MPKTSFLRILMMKFGGDSSDDLITLAPARAYTLANRRVSARPLLTIPDPLPKLEAR